MHIRQSPNWSPANLVDKIKITNVQILKRPGTSDGVISQPWQLYRFKFIKRRISSDKCKL